MRARQIDQFSINAFLAANEMTAEVQRKRYRGECID